MELDRAQAIIRSLADGRDPITGQQFPPNSPYQQADSRAGGQEQRGPPSQPT